MGYQASAIAGTGRDIEIGGYDNVYRVYGQSAEQISPRAPLVIPAIRRIYTRHPLPHREGVTMITNAGMYDIYYRIYVGNAVVDQQYWEYTRGTPCRIVRV